VVYAHSIGPIYPSWCRNYLTLELSFFEDQLRYISKNFQTIFLKEYWEIRKGGCSRYSNPLVITLDDGFLDNWIWAFPLLKKYNLRATLFVSPEFVDLTNGIRPNLEDFWNKNVPYEELMQWGYLNWAEMQEMLRSGWIDIQSHTMSHTKYVVSDKLTGFHYPGNDCLHTAGNLYPKRKPYYIMDRSFEKLIPYGYPLFEEQSAVCARKVTINPSFIEECVGQLSGYNFDQYRFRTAFAHVRNLYRHYKEKEELIVSVESENDFFQRLAYEIVGSKTILEEKLKKPIEFLCWPHGDNSEYAHQLAIMAGYLATTTGSRIRVSDTSDRIPNRIGLYQVRNNRFLSVLKFKYKVGSRLGRFPYQQVNASYQAFKKVIQKVRSF